MITAAGIGSGLDVQSIIGQLMAFERQPLNSIQRKQNILEAELSAYGQLKNALSTFEDAMKGLSGLDSFKVFKTATTDDSVLTASASSSAAIGNFGVEVVRLAAHHKMDSTEHLNTDTFGGVAGDSLNIQIGSDPADSINVDLTTASTLSDIRTAINNDANNPGVTATIINGDDGNQKLILTANSSGEDNALSLSYAGTIDANTFGFSTLNDIAGDLSLLNSEISVDGYSITRSSNNISDVISGVTLNLNNAAPGTTQTVSVTRDNEAVSASVQKFTDAYNALRSEIRSQKSGMLEADSTLLNMERGLLNVFNTPASNGMYSVLSEVGVSFQKDGSLSISDTKLSAALNSEYAGVADLFADTNDGFAVRLESLANSWLEFGGLIDARTDGLDERIDRLDNRKESIERRLITVEARYVRQFSSLDSLLGQLQGTSSFLSQQLSNVQ